MKALAALLCSLLLTPVAFGHGGGLNKDGCHNEKRTGGYHCHREPTSNRGVAAAQGVSATMARKLLPRFLAGGESALLVCSSQAYSRLGSIAPAKDLAIVEL